MNKVEKIREEIKKRYEYWKEKESNSHSIESESRISECQHLLLLFNSLQEEPVSNDLEKAAVEAFKRIVDSDKNSFYEIFKAGAQWGKEQTEIQIKAQSIALPHGCPKKEPVSKDFEYFAKKESESFAEREYEIDYIDKNALAKGYYWGAKAGAQWQKERLIDKAVKWLYEHREEVQTEDNGISGWISDELIMGFKKAMKE